MTNFNEKRFDNAQDAAEFIVQAHDEGQTVSVYNGDEYPSPHMHSNEEYEVAEREDGMVGVSQVDRHTVCPTPEGTFVMHSG